MKVSLVLLFCGLSLALASDCVNDYPEDCMGDVLYDFEITFPQAAYDLDNFCQVRLKQLDCNIDYAKKCPNAKHGVFRKPFEVIRSFLSKVCDKENSLRKKYLEKASCLQNEIEPAESHCVLDGTHDWWKVKLYSLKCTQDELISQCGADGRSMISDLFKQRFASTEVICKNE